MHYRRACLAGHPEETSKQFRTFARVSQVSDGSFTIDNLWETIHVV